MKYIKKNEPPRSLEAYCRTENANFDDMPKDVKEELRACLVDEQGGLCCYCGMRILANHHSAIEHFLPKGLQQYSYLQLTYSNLLCSCDGGEADRRGKNKTEKTTFPPHCDNKKNDNVIKISPLDKNCESLFMYDEEGHIYGVTEDASETIEILGLDCSTLVHLRKAAIDAYSTLSLTSDEEWEKEIQSVLQRTETGQFKPFCVAVAYFIRHYKMSY